jgi:Beta-propeller repeat
MSKVAVGLAAVSKRRVSLGVVNATLALATALAVACGKNGGGGNAAPTLSYGGASGTMGMVGTPMSVSPTTLANNGTVVTGCGIKPGSANASSFPATLGINSSLCVISGTPAAPLPATEFTLVATNSVGTSADATVTLTIHAGWLRQLGATSATTSKAQGVAVDGSGNSYVAGYTTGGLAGNTQAGTTDYFIAKYDALGTRIWIKQLGVASKTSIANGVAVDGSGNSYVAGYTTGGLAGNTQTGNEDYFIAKYDASGALTWFKQLGLASQQSRANGVTVDASGSSYVAGYTSGGLAGNTQAGTTDYFIAKYDASGTLTWLKQLGFASQPTLASGVAVDGSGNSYVAGYTQAGNTAYLIAKYDASGARIWLKQLGVYSGGVFADGVAVDGSGNSYVAGSTNGALPGNTQTGSEDYFIAKYDASGTPTWFKQLGFASQLSRATGVAVDASGNSYVVGLTTGGLAGNTQIGNPDYFIAKYDASGARTWLKQLGVSLGSVAADGVAVDGSGNSYVAGYTTGGLAGNPQTGTYDYFIANYNSSGSF